METFKVMSFNVRGNFQEKQPERSWDHRADLNVRTIQKYDPDIIGFQEVTADNAALYARRLVGYARDVGRTQGGRARPRWVTFNPIAWKTDRFQKVDSGGFFLSETPDVWSRGWDAAFVRAATWVRLRSRESGAYLLYVNVHLDHVSETARLNSSEVITRRLTANGENAPMIITGDFNSRAWAPADEPNISYPPAVKRDALPPGGTVHSVYTGAGFRDAYREAGHDDQLDMNTFHAFQGTDFPPCALRIDWILLRDGLQSLKTLSYQVIRDAEPPVYPSDHYPVMASVALTEEQAR